MKKQNLVIPVLLLALTFGSCSKYTGGSSNLSGTWDISSMTQKSYTNGVLDSSDVQNDLGTFTFNSDGDGNFSVDDGDQVSSGTFDWFEQNDKVFINFSNLTDQVMTKNFAIGFDVETNTATQQVWSITYSYYEDEENPNTGQTVSYLKKTYIEVELLKQ